jgi:integrase
VPFLKKNSPYYRISLDLPGFGPTGTLSTKTTRIERARAMERCLRWLADHEHYDILEALRPKGRGKSGAVDLPTVLRAKSRREIPQLKRRLDDPLLADAIAEAAKVTTYQSTILGLRHLKAIAPRVSGADLSHLRLSWLRDARHVDLLMAHMLEQGYAPRTVANSLWAAVKRLLEAQYGKAETRALLAEATRPTADDRRDTWLTPDELYRLISACEWEVRMLMVLSAALGIDQGPALRLRVRDVDWDRWRVYIPDTKTAKRQRIMDLSPPAAYALRMLSTTEMGEDRAGHERLFALTRGQINHRWRKARSAAKLTREDGHPTDVRVKDLRHTFAVAYMRSGGNVAGLGNRLGHSRWQQSLDYARHEVRGAEDMAAAAEAMGLHLPPHLAAELEAPVEAVEGQREIPAWWFDRHQPGRLFEPGGEVVELDPTGAYQERGTADYAKDPKAYFKRRRAARRAK